MGEDGGRGVLFVGDVGRFCLLTGKREVEGSASKESERVENINYWGKFESCMSVLKLTVFVYSVCLVSFSNYRV